MSGSIFECNGVIWGIDPTNNFEGVDPDKLVKSVGYIPTFINPESDDVVKEALHHYGFGGPEMTGGTIEEDGTYKYPEDPDLYPLCKGYAGDKLIFIYQFGIIAFVDTEGDGSVVHRFD